MKMTIDTKRIDWTELNNCLTNNVALSLVLVCYFVTIVAVLFAFSQAAPGKDLTWIAVILLLGGWGVYHIATQHDKNPEAK